MIIKKKDLENVIALSKKKISNKSQGIFNYKLQFNQVLEIVYFIYVN